MQTDATPPLDASAAPSGLYVVEITRPSSWRDAQRQNAAEYVSELDTALRIETQEGTEIRGRLYLSPVRAVTLVTARYEGDRWHFDAEARAQ